MKSKQSIVYLIYGIFFALMLVSILIGIPMSADRQITIHEKIDGYSDNWILPSGKKTYADNLDISDHGGRIVIEKDLSGGITDKDALCFRSENTNIRVFVDGKQVYRFYSKPNLTGNCYGVSFHEIGIGKNDAGKRIRIEIEKIYEGQRSGRIYDLYLCAVSDYFQIVIRNNLLICSLSILNIILGFVFIIAYLGAPNKSVFPFDILAIGLSSILIGIWYFIDTNVIQMITGHVYVCRDISRIIPFMIAYPSICFFNSMSARKRDIYKHLGFFISVIPIFTIISLRYIMYIDMQDSFFWFMIAYSIAGLGCLLALCVDNSIYCRHSGKANALRHLYILGAFFLVAGAVDLIRYISQGSLKQKHGSMFCVAATLYAVVMLIEFLRWWMKDNADIERDRFVNRTLQYALSSNSPDANIRSILEFLGKELDARRVFIFEDQNNGKYKGTYEWYNEGTESFSIEMMYLSSEDIIDRIYEEFNKSDHRLIIKNPEVFRNSIPGFYNLLKTNKVDNMIIVPLEVGGHLFGVVGLTGAPQKNLESVSDIINLIAYFLAQLILQRKDQDRTMFYTYKDVLAGTGNFTAFKKYIEHYLDISAPFGCVRCDLAGLNEINVSQGYEVGDQMVVVTAKALMDIFGESNVFRISGPQFIAFGFDSEEIYFENEVSRLKKNLQEKAIEANVTFVYCLYGTKDINIVLSRTESLMKESAQEKESNGFADNS